MVVVFPANIPSLAQMRSIWPGGVDVPSDDVFAPFLTSPDKVATSDEVLRAECVKHHMRHSHFHRTNLGWSVCDLGTPAALSSPPPTR